MLSHFYPESQKGIFKIRHGPVAIEVYKALASFYIQRETFHEIFLIFSIVQFTRYKKQIDRRIDGWMPVFILCKPESRLSIVETITYGDFKLKRADDMFSFA